MTPGCAHIAVHALPRLTDRSRRKNGPLAATTGAIEPPRCIRPMWSSVPEDQGTVTAQPPNAPSAWLRVVMRATNERNGRNPDCCCRASTRSHVPLDAASGSILAGSSTPHARMISRAAAYGKRCVAETRALLSFGATSRQARAGREHGWRGSGCGQFPRVRGLEPACARQAFASRGSFARLRPRRMASASCAPAASRIASAIISGSALKSSQR